MTDYGAIRLETVAGKGLRFAARFASGFETTYDTGEGAVGPNPVEHLIGALAACEAMDVVGILRKKRLEVTACEVLMSGERATENPRRFTAIELVHRFTGRGIPPAAVAEALRLSGEKYCSVRHTLDPALRITSRFELIEG
jgi:putative redox protein